MATSTPKRKTGDSDKKKSRRGVLIKWAGLCGDQDDLEKKLESVKEKKRRLESANPWLGNVKGLISDKANSESLVPSPAKKAKIEPPPPPAKRKLSPAEKEMLSKFKTKVNHIRTKLAANKPVPEALRTAAIEIGTNLGFPVPDFVLESGNPSAMPTTSAEDSLPSPIGPIDDEAFAHAMETGGATGNTYGRYFNPQGFQHSSEDWDVAFTKKD